MSFRLSVYTISLWLILGTLQFLIWILLSIHLTNGGKNGIVHLGVETLICQWCYDFLAVATGKKLT